MTNFLLTGEETEVKIPELGLHLANWVSIYPQGQGSMLELQTDRLEDYMGHHSVWGGPGRAWGMGEVRLGNRVTV